MPTLGWADLGTQLVFVLTVTSKEDGVVSNTQYIDKRTSHWDIAAPNKPLWYSQIHNLGAL